MMSQRSISWIAFVAVGTAAIGLGLRDVGAQQTVPRPTLADRLSALRRAVAGESEESGVSVKKSNPPAQHAKSRPSVRKSAGNSWRDAFNKHPTRGDSKSTSKSNQASGRSLLPSIDPLNILPIGSENTKSRSSRAASGTPGQRRGKPRTIGNIQHNSAQRSRVQHKSPPRKSPSSRKSESTLGLIRTPQRIAEEPIDPDSAPAVSTGSGRQQSKSDPSKQPYPPITVIGGKVSTISSRSSRQNRTVTPPNIQSAIKRDEIVSDTSRQPDRSRSVARKKRRAPLLIEMPADSDFAKSKKRPEPKTAAADPVAAPASRSAVVEKQAAARRDPATVPSTRPKAPVGNPVLAQHAAPAISMQVTGPEEIVLGREATYRLTVRNDGNIAANDMIAEVTIPTSADLVSSDATDGSATRGQGRVEWRIDELAAGGSAELTIALVPRSSEPLTLGTTVRLAPIAHQTIVVVQEPRLEISLKGPDDVLFGKPQVYQLKVSNPGTGTAENVVLHLLPPGASESETNSHPIGSLAAGKVETFDVELVAHNAGSLHVLASATADGGLVSECEKNVLVRRPQLAIDARGPEESYAGTIATYIFRVRNDGTADAEDISIKIELPAGATFVDASKGSQSDDDGQTVRWDVPKVSVGENIAFEIRCTVHQPGSNQVAADVATSDGALHVRETLSTHVVALADLKLEVSDPAGPVAVGEEAVYEIRVRNRGAASAEAIQIVALFSNGIDPVEVEGSEHTMHNGRVAFSPINRLAPGADATFRIRAVASEAGTHVFRAEVLCKELETKLTMEETTRYYDAGFGSRRQTTTAKRNAGAARK